MLVTIPATSLVTELGEEGVLVNLETGDYYSLDRIGLSMWKALALYGSLERALVPLLEEYEVDPVCLEQDLRALVRTLAECNLVLVGDE